VVAVPPKALAVLWTLVCQAGQVVPKEVLLESGWAETVVSEGVLASCIRQLRRVLEADPQQPPYIATVHRIGYRFVAPVTQEGALRAPVPLRAAASPPLTPASPLLCVGRQAELTQLYTRWGQAQHGARQLLFLTGEAGIGKTTLVDAFLAQLEPAVPRWLGRGQCIEHYGVGEAYLPLLFMVQVVDALVQQGLPQDALPGHASSAGAEDTRARALPPGLRDLLEAQLGRLGAIEQQVLEGGSVAGSEFAVASVAAGMSMAPEAVEAVCEGLARQGQVLEDRGLAEWPDGTVSGCYGFRHALYQEVVYQRLGAGRLARWHRVVGARLAQAYGGRTSEVAAELALHFQRGHDAQRAVQYLGQAADNAAQRQAHHEVIELLTTGLELLATLPATPARAQQELDLQLALGPALTAAKGLGPRRWSRPMPGRESCAGRWAKRPASSRPWGGCVIAI
jgi:DNA-binding winged helix-turn-helix (wHTH) protein